MWGLVPAPAALQCLPLAELGLTQFNNDSSWGEWGKGGRGAKRVLEPGFLLKPSSISQFCVQNYWMWGLVPATAAWQCLPLAELGLTQFTNDSSWGDWGKVGGGGGWTQTVPWAWFSFNILRYILILCAELVYVRAGTCPGCLTMPTSGQAGAHPPPQSKLFFQNRWGKMHSSKFEGHFRSINRNRCLNRNVFFSFLHVRGKKLFFATYRKFLHVEVKIEKLEKI